MQAHSVVEVNDKIRPKYRGFLRILAKTVKVSLLDSLAVSSPAMTGVERTVDYPNMPTACR